MLRGRPLTAPPSGDRAARGASAAEVRSTVRALLLDADDRLLLQSCLDTTVHRPAGLPHRVPVWITPGGGLAPGEPAEAGLVRELREETGIVDVAWGPWLWLRTVDLHYQGCVRRFVERYRLGRVPTASPHVAPTALEPHERDVLLDHRWWPLPELLATTATVYPPRLAERLMDVLAGANAPSVVDISHEG